MFPTQASLFQQCIEVTLEADFQALSTSSGKEGPSKKDSFGPPHKLKEIEAGGLQVQVCEFQASLGL